MTRRRRISCLSLRLLERYDLSHSDSPDDGSLTAILKQSLDSVAGDRKFLLTVAVSAGMISPFVFE